jgi:hypothetical protein
MACCLTIPIRLINYNGDVNDNDPHKKNPLPNPIMRHTLFPYKLPVKKQQLTSFILFLAKKTLLT